jgi:YHS domain-containing protein
MLRIIILLIVGYLLYKGFKSWMNKQMPPDSIKGGGRPSVPVDDVMVKDPQCGVYFPKRDSIRIEKDGEELFFCSTQCRDAFLADKQGKQSSDS